MKEELHSTVQRIAHLIHLEPGWDGYDGRPVTEETAGFAIRLLDAICGSSTSPPQIVPGSGGDLQIEWHTPKGDIELHVKAPGNVHAWRRMLAPGHEDGEEMDVSEDFSVVAEWVRQIVS